MKLSNLWILLAHDHWITINIGGRELRVCARCSGVLTGFTLFLGLTFLIDLWFFYVLPITYQILLCIILLLPAIVDWTTQKIGFRESNNRLRVFTGMFEGFSVVLLALIPIPLIQKVLIVVLVGGLTLTVGYTGRKILDKPKIERM